MGRPRKYNNPRLISLVLESDIYDEMIRAKPHSIGLGDFLSQLFLEKREKAELLSENMALKAENKALKKELAELKEKLEKLESSINSANDDLWEKVRALITERGEVKVIEVLKALGHTEMGEALQRRAREFVNEAPGHGITVSPTPDVGILGWKVQLSPAKS
ncbi:hypothetical protein [Thermococcus prieurii]